MNISKLISAAVMPLLLTGCSGERQPDPAPPEGAVLLTFTLTLDRQETATRSNGDDDSWGNNYDKDPGSEFDINLMPERFHPALFKVNGESLEKVADVKTMIFMPAGGPGQDKLPLTYTFTGMVDVEEGKSDIETLKNSTDTYRLMIFANASGMSFDHNTCFSFSGPQNKDGFDAIPMWGVGTPKFSELKAGSALNIGNIALLRAMAKVRVSLGEKLTASNNTDGGRKVKITSVSLSRYNESGYVAPGNWNKCTTTTDIKFSGTLREYESLEYPLEINIDGNETWSETVSSESVTFYIPEITNKTGDDELLLTLDYTVDDQPMSGKIHFCRYENGLPVNAENVGTPDLNSTQNYLWHIVRNHIYDFTITDVPDATVGILVNVAVKDWQRADYEIDY